ncbi:zinc-binding alcohol dehydrogenase family protein [Bacillus sp. SD088]|uniref:zinc-binding alcohol dehydrogenase family protein n=1 Tax=Bacillus sp. SD088 TaxID=2782012 RepID=UPI001A972694|nr:zinc-binding alcohol dehydrogenase family protein [Bacillus sp. SD088]MBO0995364.1 zinc-binding alcohol dehydrogenase family protein [Bacillus sp. SD088]
MKSIVCEEPHRLRMKEIPFPTKKVGEALIRIKRIGVCGTDLHAYKGNQPYFTYPRILGHELSGLIIEIDQNDAGLEVGDSVSVIPYLHCGSCIACRNGKTNCCTSLSVIGVHQDGGMCEVLSVPVQNLVKAEGITLDQAAIMEPLAIGAHAVRRSAVREGETVLVIGAGPIGLGVMAFAKQQGARVIAMDVNEERLQFCKAWAQVAATIQAGEQSVSILEEQISGDLPTIVFDATGNVHSMEAAFQYVAHGGKLIYVGLVENKIRFFDPDFHKKELALLGSRNATSEDFDYVLKNLQTGVIKSRDYITHHCSFNEVLNQFGHWLLPESKVIKAMIEL